MRRTDGLATSVLQIVQVVGIKLLAMIMSVTAESVGSFVPGAAAIVVVVAVPSDGTSTIIRSVF